MKRTAKTQFGPDTTGNQTFAVSSAARENEMGSRYIQGPDVDVRLDYGLPLGNLWLDEQVPDAEAVRFWEREKRSEYPRIQREEELPKSWWGER